MLRDKYGADAQIEWEHHLIHDGKMFLVMDEDTDVDIGSPKYWVLRVGSSGPIHMAVQATGTAGLKIEVYEGPTITVAGSALPVVCMNRANLKTIGVTAEADPTVTVDGTLIGIARAGGATRAAGGGSARQEASEFVLRASTNYAVKVTVVADNTTVTMDASVYQPDSA